MNNNSTSKTPSQDAQGRWYELLSPTQVLTGEDQQPLTKLATSTTTQSKKKCRGNRKAQRERRKLRLREENKRHLQEKMSSMNEDVTESERPEEQQQSLDVSF